MTLKEAEVYFKSYDGHYFNMGREEPNIYREFISMGISGEVFEKWRQELVDGYIMRLKNGDVVPMTNYGLIDTVSSIVRIIFDIIVVMKNNKYDNISLLFDVISAIDIPDKREKIYVMESITKNCRYAVRYGLGEKMNNVFKKIADFPITEADKNVSTGYGTIPERYESAVKKYMDIMSTEEINDVFNNFIT